MGKKRGGECLICPNMGQNRGEGGLDKGKTLTAKKSAETEKFPLLSSRNVVHSYVLIHSHLFSNTPFQPTPPPPVLKKAPCILILSNLVVHLGWWELWRRIESEVQIVHYTWLLPSVCGCELCPSWGVQGWSRAKIFFKCRSKLCE